MSGPEHTSRLSTSADNPRRCGEGRLQFPAVGLRCLADIDPLTQFEFSDLLSAHRYVMEWNLYNWIAGQNSAQGVAPSREQVFAQFPAQISVHAPVQIKERLRRLARGSARKQRKWLARFRGRWGARLGVLRVQEHVSLEDGRVKVGDLGVDVLGSILGPLSGSIFGSAFLLLAVTV